MIQTLAAIKQTEHVGIISMWLSHFQRFNVSTISIQPTNLVIFFFSYCFLIFCTLIKNFTQEMSCNVYSCLISE